MNLAEPPAQPRSAEVASRFRRTGWLFCAGVLLTGALAVAAESPAPAGSPAPPGSSVPELDMPRAQPGESTGDGPPQGAAGKENRQRQARSLEAENRRPRNRDPRLIRIDPPEYPEEFSGTGITAEVIVSIIVDRLGRASHIRVEQSPDQAFTDAALGALAGAEFMPATKRGKITNAYMHMSVVVSEELGDRPYLKFPGGRIILEGTRYGGSHDVPVRRLFGLRPAFPFDLLVDSKPGEVLIDFTIGESGVPRDVEVIESTHQEFTLAVKGALVHWRFSPALFHGRAVPVRMRYRLMFRPDEIPENLRAIARSLAIGRLDGLVPASQIDEQPRVSYMMNPTPPPEAVGGEWRRRRVTVNVVVNEHGDVQLPRVVASPDPLTGYIALAAVGYWHFSPAIKDKQPVPVNVTFPMTF